MLKIGEYETDAIDELKKNLHGHFPDYLCRTYYVERLLRLIARRWIIGEWRRYVAAASTSDDFQPPFPLEYGASLLSKSTNYTIDPDEVSEGFDRLAEEARTYFAQNGGISDTVERRAKELVHYLLDVQNFKPNTRDYYNVNNSYIDKVLETKRGIPISLALVFSVVGRRLGLQIDMVGFPQHFLTRITTEDGSHRYIDCFDGGKFRSRADCVALLNDMGLIVREEYLEPAPDAEVYIRMATNILNAVHTSAHGVEDEDAHSHAYGAMLTILLLSPTATSLNQQHQYRRIFYNILRAEVPEDIWFAEQDLAELKKDAEAYARDIAYLEREIGEIWEEDENAGVGKVGEATGVGAQGGDGMVRSREEGKVHPSYFVGQLMTHVKYEYSGLIFGWDLYCKADEHWIMRMGVDRLRLGRLQPFYKVMSVSSTTNERSFHYVAEENILVRNDCVDPGLFLRKKDLGKWFDRWDARLGMFVPNAEVRREYPDDWRL
ncbi:hypothetical protein HDV00_005956 [Rhizophlyctis rosea]|nr:hypothetical protein HDV00_005956 [Rhizophlyctis rosea]